MHFIHRINRGLDAVAHAEVRLGDREWSAFHVCGYLGLALAIIVILVLTMHRDMPQWGLGAVVLTGVATFLTLAMLTKILIGEERLVYYHHEIAILATTALVLRLLEQPVLAYLDITILGVGTFLVCGRVGCFMVGCCHGRPRRLGVRYRSEHCDAGFAPCLVGVRLFPIQLIESAWLFVTVILGMSLVLRGAAPGEALAWYIIAYGIGRFSFEFFRGDQRPYRGGFSEAQWTSLFLMLVVVAAESSGTIPLHRWHFAVTGGLALAMMAATLRRRLTSGARQRLLSVQNIHQIAEAAEQLTAHDGQSGAIAVATTSVGLHLSSGHAVDGAAGIEHYTLSSTSGESFSEADARVVADLLLHLRHEGGPGEVVRGREGVFHVVVRRSRSQGVVRGHAPLREAVLR